MNQIREIIKPNLARFDAKVAVGHENKERVIECLASGEEGIGVGDQGVEIDAFALGIEISIIIEPVFHVEFVSSPDDLASEDRSRLHQIL